MSGSKREANAKDFWTRPLKQSKSESSTPISSNNGVIRIVEPDYLFKQLEERLSCGYGFPTPQEMLNQMHRHDQMKANAKKSIAVVTSDLTCLDVVHSPQQLAQIHPNVPTLPTRTNLSNTYPPHETKSYPNNLMPKKVILPQKASEVSFIDLTDDTPSKPLPKPIKINLPFNPAYVSVRSNDNANNNNNPISLQNHLQKMEANSEQMQKQVQELKQEMKKISCKPIFDFVDAHKGSITYLEVRPHKEAVYGELPADLPKPLKMALIIQNYKRLYKHQLDARKYIKQVCVTTPTSSGKSLCFNIPVFEAILRAFVNKADNPETVTPSALYLFPLNALAKDQEEKLQSLNESLPAEMRLKIITINGTVSVAERIKMFNGGVPDILITNPDILHHQINRDWEGWIEFVKKLRFIILDEAHTYGGVLGSHMTNLIRRLFNYTDQVGGQADRIQFIISSATVGNSAEISLKMTGRASTPFRLRSITESSAKTPERCIVCLEATDKPSFVISDILVEWINLRITGIVFCNNIQAINQLMYYLQSKPRYRDYVKKIRPYYASLKQDYKEATLKELQTGEVKILIASNALEAGIDIPALDACLLKGYPGSRMSLFQRIGRAGRSNPGLVVFVPSTSNPLDQYFAENPKVLFGSEIECVAFNADYPGIKSNHLSCAASEIGLFESDALKRFGKDSIRLLENLENENVVKKITEFMNGKEQRKWVGVKGNKPHLGINIRGTAASEVSALDQNGNLVEKLDGAQALHRLFPGALFPSYDPKKKEMVKYQSCSLDFKLKKAVLKEVIVADDLVSLPLRETEVCMTTEEECKTYNLGFGTITLKFGWGIITNVVNGYKMFMKSESDEKVTSEFQEPVLYPEPLTLSYEAPCLEFELSESAQTFLHGTMITLLEHNSSKETRHINQKKSLLESNGSFVALHTLLHQLITVVPLLLLSTNDIDEANLNDDCAYLVDTAEGGTGVCEQVFHRFQEFVKKAEELTSSCRHCDSFWGCAVCMYQHHCSEMNANLLQVLGVKTLNIKQ